MERENFWVRLIMLLESLAIVAVWAFPSAAGASSPSISPDPAAIDGRQTFPPSNLSDETAVLSLASWFGQALGLAVVSAPTTRTLGIPFTDAFDRSVEYSANAYDFPTDSGVSLRLYYVTNTGSFVAFEARFASPRSIEQKTLQDFSASMAAALNISLENASYAEFSITDPVDAPNGTGQSTQTYTVGDWFQLLNRTEVNFANQLRVVIEAGSQALTYVRGFRWFSDPPSLKFQPSEIVRVASETVNESFGVTGRLVDHSIGVTPNYVNQTWSVLVGVSFAYEGGGGETFVLLLDSTTLEFQILVKRLAVVSSQPPLFELGSAITLLVLVSLAAFAASVLAVAWFGYVGASWACGAASLVLPLYSRLKRESVTDHFLRGRIVEFLIANPGATFSVLQQRFRVATGVLSYHLGVLEKTGYISAIREGGHTRHYVEGTSGREPPLLSPFQCSVLRAISAKGRTRLRDLSTELRSSRQRVHYNIKRLSEHGFVTIERERGRRILKLSREGVDLLSSIAAPPSDGSDVGSGGTGTSTTG